MWVPQNPLKIPLSKSFPTGDDSSKVVPQGIFILGGAAPRHERPLQSFQESLCSSERTGTVSFLLQCTFDLFGMTKEAEPQRSNLHKLILTSRTTLLNLLLAKPS